MGGTNIVCLLPLQLNEQNGKRMMLDFSKYQTLADIWIAVVKI